MQSWVAKPGFCFPFPGLFFSSWFHCWQYRLLEDIPVTTIFLFLNFRILFIFLYSRFLLVIHFIHISIYMSIPISPVSTILKSSYLEFWYTSNYLKRETFSNSKKRRKLFKLQEKYNADLLTASVNDAGTFFRRLRLWAALNDGIWPLALSLGSLRFTTVIFCFFPFQLSVTSSLLQPMFQTTEHHFWLPDKIKCFKITFWQSSTIKHFVGCVYVCVCVCVEKKVRDCSLPGCNVFGNTCHWKVV